MVFHKTKGKTIELFQQASDLGDTNAMVNLAVCYSKGYGVSQDKKKAFELYQRAADMGNTKAISSCCVMSGDCCHKTKREPLNCFKGQLTWATQKHCSFLVIAFWKGNGVSQDKKKAIELLQIAADMGNTDAKAILAACFEKGNGISQDKRRTIGLHETRAEMRNTHALAQLNRQDQRMTIRDLTEDELVSFIQSAESGDMEAASLLSSLPD